jgi:hypothetical protein
MRERGGQRAPDPGPAAGVTQPEIHERQESGDDEEELQHFVVDGARQPADEHVDEHDEGGRDNADMEDVLRSEAERGERRVEDVQDLQQLRHRVHRNAGREHRHQRERDRIEAARLLVESKPQVLRYRPRARPVIERHHEDAKEDHRRDRADPVEMAGRDAVLRTGRCHADDFLRAQVGRNERQAAHPRGDRASRLKEVHAGRRRALQCEADTQHEPEVDEHQHPVEPGKRHTPSDRPTPID